MAEKKKTETEKPAANAGFMKAMQPSEALAKIVGLGPLPRTEVTKIWEYIKKNKLQDEKNKWNINADANLLAVFGGKGLIFPALVFEYEGFFRFLICCCN